jgi:hypothetical protein
LSLSIEYQYGIASALNGKNFVVNGVQRHIICVTTQLCFWTLYDPFRRFFSTGAASEDQNSLCKWIGRNDLIMDRIYRKIMRRTRYQGCLSFKDSYRCLISIRQTGEGRDPRMAYSVGH